ncbi:CshA/CshB family fibrillar adhesin-related protein [Lysobacter sp. CCNWLW3]
MAGLPGPARAGAWATGGSSPYRSQILWLTWGDPSGTTTGNGTQLTRLANGHRSIASVTVNGVPLVVTCTLGNYVTLAGTPPPGSFSWRPGFWQGDLLDELYNVGGVGAANQLVNGINVAGGVMTFTVTCFATLNGQPYDIPGMVMADAEQSGNSPYEAGFEYIQSTADGAWNVVERSRVNCAEPYRASLSANGQTLTLAGPANANCAAAGRAGPMATGFLRFNPTAYGGANRQVVISFRMNGGGATAAAIGLVIPVDGGDAPAIYGTAAHLINPAYSADSLAAPSTAVDVFGAGFTLSAPTNADPQMLGTTVDSNATVVNSITVVTQAGNVAASVDDASGATPDDEAAFATLPAIEGTATSYSLTVPLAATAALGGQVCGWVDFDRGGSFGNDTAEEACATFVAGAASAVLNWTLPAGNAYVAGNSYARLRIARDAASAGVPSGLANIGEVEDYPIVLRPRLRLNKATVPTTDGGLFNLTVNPAPTAAFTANDQGHGGTTGFQSIPLGSAVTLSETAGTNTNLAAYTGNMTCTNRASGTVYGPTAGTSHSYTTMSSASTNAAVSNTPATAANVNDTEITCVLSNTLNADLSITKSNTYTAAQPSDLPGDTVTGGANTTYTLVVTNHGLMPVTGAVVRDASGAGITCPVGNAVTIAGDGVPAGSFNIGHLTGAAGIALGTLGAGQSTTLSFTCTVN